MPRVETPLELTAVAGPLTGQVVRVQDETGTRYRYTVRSSKWLGKRFESIAFDAPAQALVQMRQTLRELGSR